MTPARRLPFAFSATLLLIGLAACQQGATADEGGTWIPEVVARYPHDSNAFTQGLLFHDDKLYESTGSPEGQGRPQSSLRRVDIETGRIERIKSLDSRLFGEGLALVDDRLYQLTWQAGEALVHRLDDFRLIETFRYDGQGWGLTYDGEQLIMSDGTATLRFIDPADFSVQRTVTVTRDGAPQIDLNELEYIDGEVWANIWYQDRVARIDPADGRIVGWIDLSALYPASQRPRDAVVNGIAWDPGSDRLFVTGKNWPAIFEIAIDERN
jgi:glutaminyl-peptide cyclotransferase